MGTDKRIEFQSLYQLLVDDETRHRAICDAVVHAVRVGRSPLILTERNEHLDRFEGLLSARVPHVVVLRGGWGRSSGGQWPTSWQPFHPKRVASSSRRANTLERASMMHGGLDAYPQHRARKSSVRNSRRSRD